MGADITRDSYDEPQQYRQLVNQQGRVTLDADLNEAQTILREETRKEALDFVGPAGSPDDGYHIRVPSPLPSGWKPFDFQIDAGTLYVGGLRVELPLKTRWSQQTDWLDQPTLKADRSSMREAIVLRLSEQEVSAVEDNAVREVALGGPDTAQRLRLLRHVARFDVEANDCKTALEQVLTALSAEGLEFKPATLRLLPKARLRVSFTNPPKPADKCEPAAQGGYLEAANQCLRVQVSGSNKVLWGFDDASALYRVDIVKIDTTKGETTLRLQTDPVDEEHYPRSEWVFEVLRATARLANGEYVAASSGVVAKLKGSYDPDERTLTLDKALVAPFKAGVKLPPVFLRVWQEELTVVANQQLKLGTTGVQIRLNAGARPLGAFWRFAVRPNTPAEIFPKRYLKSGQPPEGPRQWLCPLAFIHWNEDGVHAKIDDCRPVFDNLVELTARKTGGGCCTVTLGPDDLEKKTLQATVDSLAEKGTATVCLLPGVYA
ncbi:MAG TPA: DUF6519 domain-containing protein, partial [Gemmataceae bacterium]|nr:DUF6519 domain-containing protein [Gemmataceae bacterium]